MDQTGYVPTGTGERHLPLPLLTTGQDMRPPPLSKWASFAKIRLKWTYFVFSGAQKSDYILKKRESWHGFLEISDYCAILDEITQ